MTGRRQISTWHRPTCEREPRPHAGCHLEQISGHIWGIGDVEGDPGAQGLHSSSRFHLHRQQQCQQQQQRICHPHPVRGVWGGGGDKGLDLHSGPLLSSKDGASCTHNGSSHSCWNQSEWARSRVPSTSSLPKCTPDCQETEFTLKKMTQGWKGLLAASNG